MATRIYIGSPKDRVCITIEGIKGEMHLARTLADIGSLGRIAEAILDEERAVSFNLTHITAVLEAKALRERADVASLMNLGKENIDQVVNPW